MAVFPSEDPAYTLSQRAQMKPLVGQWTWQDIDFVKKTDSESGKSLYRDVWGRTRGVGQGTWSGRNDTMAIVYNFWRTYRLGQTFVFFNFDEDYVIAESIGTGNGGTVSNLTLAAKDVRNLVIYQNGVVKPSNTVTLSNATGTNTEDRVTITTTTSGAALTATYIGRKRYLTCEFPEPPSRTNMGHRLQTIELKIREVF